MQYKSLHVTASKHFKRIPEESSTLPPLAASTTPYLFPPLQVTSPSHRTSSRRVSQVDMSFLARTTPLPRICYPSCNLESWDSKQKSKVHFKDKRYQPSRRNNNAAYRSPESRQLVPGSVRWDLRTLFSFARRDEEINTENRRKLYPFPGAEHQMLSRHGHFSTLP